MKLWRNLTSKCSKPVLLAEVTGEGLACHRNSFVETWRVFDKYVQLGDVIVPIDLLRTPRVICEQDRSILECRWRDVVTEMCAVKSLSADDAGISHFVHAVRELQYGR